MQVNGFRNVSFLIRQMRGTSNNGVQGRLESVLAAIFEYGAPDDFYEGTTGVTRDVRLRIYARELERRGGAVELHSR